jgi:HEPN domain-containing protein
MTLETEKELKGRRVLYLSYGVGVGFLCYILVHQIVTLLVIALVSIIIGSLMWVHSLREKTELQQRIRSIKGAILMTSIPLGMVIFYLMVLTYPILDQR